MSSETLDEFRSVLSQVPLKPTPDESSRDSLRRFLEKLFVLAHEIESKAQKYAVLHLASHHISWHVRRLSVDVAIEWLPLKEAEEVLLALTHDSVDVVAFRAIRACGEVRLQSAVTHLARISGWPSNFTRAGYLRKPVGIGAALTKRALTDILGSTDPSELLECENKVLLPYRQMLANARRVADTKAMIFVKGGECTVGTHPRSDFRFEYKDYVPEHKVEVDAFYIDKYPVTNQEYVRFASAIELEDHTTCHPDEPRGKDHWPSHLSDPRFSHPDMPVTGIDWYDAFAFASWSGKQLPTENQWEKAARGTDGRDYPWGNDWQSDCAHYVESAFGRTIRDLDEWEALLILVHDQCPSEPVRTNGRYPNGDSPYGVSDLAGNVWEWTRTNFYSGKPMDPYFRGRPVLEFTNRPEAFPVIRGGCWTSLPEMLRTFYRGKDLLTDRHFEIGFRCVVEISAVP